MACRCGAAPSFPARQRLQQSNQVLSGAQLHYPPPCQQLDHAPFATIRPRTAHWPRVSSLFPVRRPLIATSSPQFYRRHPRCSHAQPGAYFLPASRSPLHRRITTSSSSSANMRRSEDEPKCTAPDCVGVGEHASHIAAAADREFDPLGEVWSALGFIFFWMIISSTSGPHSRLCLCNRVVAARIQGRGAQVAEGLVQLEGLRTPGSMRARRWGVYGGRGRRCGCGVGRAEFWICGYVLASSALQPVRRRDERRLAEAQTGGGGDVADNGGDVAICAGVKGSPCIARATGTAEAIVSWTTKQARRAGTAEWLGGREPAKSTSPHKTWGMMGKTYVKGKQQEAQWHIHHVPLPA
ncbi:hypothetical protein B0H10DRAFT_1954215 [Mycena sp. CBHHK59/15]|nr:hypothetical protein B0H10DRAFT_1954215 [Mycena sp. CBHHK59/15]